MTDTIPDHVGREAVRLLTAEAKHGAVYYWPQYRNHVAVITVAKLLMNPPAPMTDPDEEAAKRVVQACTSYGGSMAAATEQMRKEREAWEAGR